MLKPQFTDLGTANLNSIPQLRIPQNCKRCSATANPHVCGNFSHFHNRKCTLHFRKLRPHYILSFCFRDDFIYLWRSNSADDQTLISKKKVISSQTFTLHPEIRSLHIFRAVLSRIRQHCLLICGKFQFFTANICGRKLGPQIRK